MSLPITLKHVCWSCGKEEVTVLSVPVADHWDTSEGAWFTYDKRHIDTVGRITRDEMAALEDEDEAQTWEDGYGIKHPKGWMKIEGEDDLDVCLCPKCNPIGRGVRDER